MKTLEETTKEANIHAKYPFEQGNNKLAFLKHNTSVDFIMWSIGQLKFDWAEMALQQRSINRE